MNCEQARNLFDGYLNGELSSGLESELAAHRLSCSGCRHELALLEVAGHVISADGESEDSLDDRFTDRLLACIEPERANDPVRIIATNRWLQKGALAAAAVIALIVTIRMWTPEERVAGERYVKPAVDTLQPADNVVRNVDSKDAEAGNEVQISLAADELVQQFESTWTSRADNAQAILELGQTTLLQILDQFGTDQSEENDESFDTLPPTFEELAPESGNNEIQDL